MKKIIALCLLAALLISLGACAKENAPKGMQVGCARSSFTPDFPVEMPGFGNTFERISNGYLDPVCVTALVFQDVDGNSAILLSVDLTEVEDTMTANVRKAVQEATGVPAENIMLAATHDHSAPNYANPAVVSLISESAVEASKEAMADMGVAEIYVGHAKTEGLTFVRHYVQDSGTYFGDNFGSASAGKIVSHTTEADRDAPLIRFVREGKKDIIVMNFQSHPTTTSGPTRTNISADFIGACRMEMEKRLDCHFMYFTGAAGNLNPNSRIEEENIHGKDWIDHGKALADYAIAALDSMEKVDGGKIQVLTTNYTGEVNHSDDDKADYVAIVQAAAKTGGNSYAQQIGPQYGIHSVYHANAIASRMRLGATMDMKLSVLAVGDLAFVAAPYEMFDTNGMFIKENSPFKQTFIMECANDYYSYIPSAFGYEHGCYEADMTRFSPGTGEKLADEFVSMLNQLNAGK